MFVGSVNNEVSALQHAELKGRLGESSLMNPVEDVHHPQRSPIIVFGRLHTIVTKVSYNPKEWNKQDILLTFSFYLDRPLDLYKNTE
jgi:hypothetical protein